MFPFSRRSRHQTSPNDLMQFLNNPAIHLYAVWQQKISAWVVCYITEEGGLDKDSIAQIQIGSADLTGILRQYC